MERRDRERLEAIAGYFRKLADHHGADVRNPKECRTMQAASWAFEIAYTDAAEMLEFALGAADQPGMLL